MKRVLVKKFVKGSRIIYEMECLNCRNNFEMNSSDYKRGRGYFCSNQCQGKMWGKNGIVSGKNNPMYNKKGIDNPRYGIKHTEEVKEKIKQKMTGRKIPKEIRIKMGRKGKDNKNWKGGIEKAKIRWRRRYENTLRYKINNSMRVGVWKALKDKKASKKWEIIVGYNLQDLIKHLENQFDNKMDWDNYGSYWWIDHIKPQSLFNFNGFKNNEFKKCWALKNLQPLEKIENMKKNNKY